METLKWDSDFFGFSVNNLYISRSDHHQLVSKLESINVKLCYILTDQPIEDISIFSYCGSKVIYEKLLENKYQIQSTHIIPVDELYFLHHLEVLKSLAYLSGAFSRFRLDQNFESHVFHSMYDQWLFNAIQKKFDNLFFVYTDAFGMPIGLITANFDIIKKKCRVGLLAVDTSYQGKGIGSALLVFLEQLCKQNEIERLQIPTHLENVNSCKFYKKMGYKPIEANYIYHYWK